MNARRAVLLDTGASGPRAREATGLQASLTARGFSFERSSDPRDVITRLADHPADVLIVDADSPWLDMREFVEALRRDPRTARTLIAALVTGDPRELPARREIALILAKPINPDDAASRLEGLVITRQRAVTNTRELRGDLSQLPLPDLLQLLSVSRSSGSLTLDAPGRHGSLVMDNGDLRDVVAGPTNGIKALTRLLQFGEGAFVFTPGAPPPSERMETLPLGPALFEATRQIDEIQRLRTTLPDAWIEIRRSARAVSPAMRTQISAIPALGEIERLLDAPRSLGALLDGSPLTDLDLLQALDAFRKEGLLEFAGSAGADRTEVLDAGLRAALVARLEETGRTVARMLVVVDSAIGLGDGALLRALGYIAGFVPTEAVTGSSIPLGPLGMMLSGDARVELFAVPYERDLYPLWAVFGAGADAAIFAAPPREGTDDVQILSAEVGLPVATLEGPLTTRTLANALRSALEQLNPRR